MYKRGTQEGEGKRREYMYKGESIKGEHQGGNIKGGNSKRENTKEGIPGREH